MENGKCYKLSAAANIALNCRKSAQMEHKNECQQNDVTKKNITKIQ